MKELFETYPKAAKVVCSWFLDKMLESLDTNKIPDDYKETIRKQGLPSDKVSTMVENNPRALFDVFDKHQIYIETVIDSDIMFWWKIGENQSSVGYDDRKSAEMDAVREAFKLLDEKV